jgi:hypothetical protein
MIVQSEEHSDALIQKNRVVVVVVVVVVGGGGGGGGGGSGGGSGGGGGGGVVVVVVVYPSANFHDLICLTLLPGLRYSKHRSSFTMDLNRRAFLAMQDRKHSKWRREDEVRVASMNLPNFNPVSTPAPAIYDDTDGEGGGDGEVVEGGGGDQHAQREKEKGAEVGEKHGALDRGKSRERAESRGKSKARAVVGEKHGALEGEKSRERGEHVAFRPGSRGKSKERAEVGETHGAVDRRKSRERAESRGKSKERAEVSFRVESREKSRERESRGVSRGASRGTSRAGGVVKRPESVETLYHMSGAEYIREDSPETTSRKPILPMMKVRRSCRRYNLF